jgi:hypothetical protein
MDSIAALFVSSQRQKSILDNDRVQRSRSVKERRTVTGNRRVHLAAVKQKYPFLVTFRLFG